MTEPVLSPDDLRLWDVLQKTAWLHARTSSHARAISNAKRVIDQCECRYSNVAIMWSGGKDSTVMVHLVCVAMGIPWDVISEKDDLDYPGEEDYLSSVASDWGFRLRVVHPSTSLLDWLRGNAEKVRIDNDFSVGRATLTEQWFFDTIEAAAVNRDAILLGLRADESRGRMLNRASRGTLYTKRSGVSVCTPLADWTGLDVFAYCANHGIELLPLYRCLSLMHAREPWRLRKSWWLPAGDTRCRSIVRHGGIAWLRHYWPSLYGSLVEWLPRSQGFV